jgi:hypothetical protein
MSHCVARQVDPDVLKDHSAFLFRVYQPFFLDCLSPKMKALYAIETLEITCPLIWRHIPEDMNLQVLFL